MNFYDNINNLISAFKECDEYKSYIALKEEIRKDEKTYVMLKDFKDKQSELQMNYINGQDVSKEKQEEMQNLYSIIIQNESCRKLFECEIRVNILLTDLQKELGTAVEELVKF